MKNDKARQRILTIVLAVVGVLLPQLGKLLGAAPDMLLLIHIPVLLAGMLAGPSSGMIVAAASAVCGCLLFDSPPAFPQFPVVTIELLAYGAAAGMLRYRLKLSVYLSLVCSMLAGRIAFALAGALVVLIFRLDTPVGLSVFTAFRTGLPGVTLQLLALPLVVKFCEKK